MKITDPAIWIPAVLVGTLIVVTLANSVRRWWAAPIVKELREIRKALGGGGLR